jgi:hypothetical protein
MLSMTDAETPKVSFATPDEVRQASEKAFNIWLGAVSPLWAPFLAATAAGLGFWSMSQAVRRGLGFTSLEMTPDAHLFAKWPGFALPFATPWSKGWGEAAEEADHISEVAYEALSAPLQIAFEAGEKLEAAIDEAIAAAHESLDVVTPKTSDLFSAAETADRAPAEAVTKAAGTIAETTEKTADAAVEVTSKTARTAEKAAETATKAAETTAKAAVDQTEKTATAVTKSARAVIDPVTETPVVPSVAEATAEKLPLPLADVSPALTPRKPKKPKA